MIEATVKLSSVQVSVLTSLVLDHRDEVVALLRETKAGPRSVTVKLADWTLETLDDILLAFERAETEGP
jgi:hypothetical protein